MSNNMNKLQMAHIGGELVLISGVAFYFNKRITETNDKIAELMEENEELRTVVVDLQEKVNQLGRVCYMLQTGVNVQQEKKTIVRNEVHETPKRRTQEVVKNRKNKNGMKQPVQYSSEEDSGMETFDDRDLDAELEDEIKELNKSRCVDGTCTLLDE
jgi:hypothetical protein